jgi:hypothetical protein
MRELLDVGADWRTIGSAAGGVECQRGFLMGRRLVVSHWRAVPWHHVSDRLAANCALALDAHLGQRAFDGHAERLRYLIGRSCRNWRLARAPRPGSTGRIVKS